MNEETDKQAVDSLPKEESENSSFSEKNVEATTIVRSRNAAPTTDPHGTADSVAQPLQGQKFGEYNIEYCLGVGGMGEVWLAHRNSDSLKVAIKILRTEYLQANPDFHDRFMNEIRHTSKMNHPNIIKAYDGGIHEDTAFMVAEFIDGKSVDDYREEKGGVLEEKEALNIVRAVAEGLRYAWNNFNLIHRDIKPANIMLTQEGVPKLMDMGLSKSLEHNEKALTVTGEVLGSPSYMSPEQASARKNIDFKADIYCLGTTLYRMVTGEIPFTLSNKNESIFVLLKKVITEPLPNAKEKNPKLSRPCCELIQTMTEKAPESRQDSWEEVIRDIDLVLAGKSIRRSTTNPAGGTGSNLLIFVIVGTTIAILVLMVVIYMIFGR